MVNGGWRMADGGWRMADCPPISTSAKSYLSANDPVAAVPFRCDSLAILGAISELVISHPRADRPLLDGAPRALMLVISKRGLRVLAP